MAGRGIARELLGLYCGEHPAAIRFRFGRYGKPYLSDAVNGGGLYFNYTDSEGRALYAFADGCELGIDLEHLARAIRYRRIAARKFTESESAALLELPDSAGRRAFLGCWTRKEAYGKARGVGICYPLDSVDLCSDLVSPEMTIRDAGPSDAERLWNLRQFNPDEQFVAAIVYAGASRQLRYFRYP